jgi:hypothetical protein
LEREKVSSSSSRNSDEPRGLSYILFSAFAFLVGWFLSKETLPVHKTGAGITPQDDTGKEGDGAPNQAPIIPNVMPAPPTNDKSQYCRYPHTPWWKTAAELIGIVAIVWYASITHSMWHEMQSQTATARQQIVIDQRAWLKFSDDPNTPFMKGQPIGIPFHITNIGKTPAEHLWWAVYTVFAPMGEEPDLPSNHIVPNDMIYKLDRKETRQVDIPHQEMERALLYPTDHDDAAATLLEKVSENGKFRPKPFVSPEWDRFAQGKSYVVAFGEVWYLDVFGVTHWTKFCVSKSATGENTSRKCTGYAQVDNNTQ